MSGGARVFISHTSDMAGHPVREASFVRAAIDAVNRARLVPVDMAYFAARDGQPAQYCQEQVRGCDVYVALVGFRYGSIVPETSVSYTELEFLTATAAGLPRLVFLLDESSELPAERVDADRSRIDGFRARLGQAGLILRVFSTMDRLGFEVFHALTELDLHGGGGPARDTMPAGQAVFVGRDDELERITAAVGDAASTGGVVAIHAIDGMPGIGKTALAVRAAHRLAGRFPDRRLFVDLHGHTPGHEPVDPADALADLLRADGLDPRRLPDGVQARSALWRNRMSAKRVLLVLDNARSTAQVRPLLPGSSSALVLITSRLRLADLGEAAHLNLRLLSPDDAVAMFLRLVPRARAEPEAVKELVEVCGFLPLAIAITASRFGTRPTWSVADLLTELRASGRVLTVKGEDATVRAAFDLSYRHLPPERQGFFRLLGLYPGVDIDTYAAAALTGIPLDEAIEHLDELYNDHLLEETSPRRYRMHDLVRAYTQTLADLPAVRDVAIERLLDYYQHTADRADRLTARRTRPATTMVAGPAAAPDLGGWDAAAGWLRVERANLLACLHHAATRDQHHRVVGLTAGLANLLRTEGPWNTAVDLHLRAASHARHVGDRLARAHALHDLAVVRRLSGDYPGADELLSEALGLYGVLDDVQGRAHALHDLGAVRRLTGDYPGADELLRQALGLHRALGDRLGEAHALHRLGGVRWLTGDYGGADELLRQALDLHRVLDNRQGQANALHDLGVVRRLTGNYPGADELLRQALDLHRALDHRLGQANALYGLGVVGWLTGDYPGADELLRQAFDLYHALDSRHGQAYTRTQIAVVRYLTGDHAAAEDLLQRALVALRAVGASDDEAEALNHLATLRRLTGHPDQARGLHEQARVIAHAHGHRLEEARALDGVGRAAADLGDTVSAASYLRQALDLYRALGVPEATRVESELTALI